MLLGQMYNQASPSTIVSSLQSNNEDRMHPFLSQSSEEPSHPIFHNVTGSNVEVVQQRNDTVNQGAFVKAKWNTTVTIWYKIVNWDNTTYETPLLYGDDGGNYLNSSTTKAGLKMEYNYTTTENITITYLDEPVTLTNTSVSYFSVKLNLTADYISFYAIVIYTNQEGLKQVLLEGRGSPYPLVQNLISTNNAFFKTEATLEFFIQTENVTIHINATSLPVNSTYYIQYRSGTSDLLVGEFKEDKLDLGLNETNRDVNTTISLGQFEVGTKIDFRLKIRHNDTRLNYTRSVFEPALHRVEIFDGQPSLEFSVNTTYSRLGTFFFSFNASVPRGEITSYTLWINDTTQPNGYFEISTPNLKLNATNYTYSFTTPGVYQANFTVETAKGLSANKSLIVIFDNEKPFLEFTKPKGAIEGQLVNWKLIYKCSIKVQQVLHQFLYHGAIIPF